MRGVKKKRELSLSLFLFLFSLSLLPLAPPPPNSYLVPHQNAVFPSKTPGAETLTAPSSISTPSSLASLLPPQPLLRLRELGEVAEVDVGGGAVRAKGVVLVLAHEQDLVGSWELVGRD